MDIDCVEKDMSVVFRAYFLLWRNLTHYVLWLSKSLNVIVRGVLPLTGTFSVIVLPLGSSSGFPTVSTHLLFPAMFWLIQSSMSAFSVWISFSFLKYVDFVLSRWSCWVVALTWELWFFLSHSSISLSNTGAHILMVIGFALTSRLSWSVVFVFLV